MSSRPLVPPFDSETAAQKVQMAEDLWNTKDPDRVVLAYTEDCEWRNRDEFLRGREQLRDFLQRKWARELDYRLEKRLFAFQEDRIAVQFEYESRDEEGQWWRSFGLEHWEFGPDGRMARRTTSINDVRIDESERRIGVERA